ncbi:MAG: glycosyltransferase family 4 protein [Limisphaerales bacterium]
MARLIIVWGSWSPYHCKRFEAFRDHATRQGHHATGVSLFSGSSDYQWETNALPEGVVHIDLGKDETRFPFSRINRLLLIPRRLKTDVALLPSYDHWSLALNTAVRMFGGRVVMMNDTHAGTARAQGLKAAFKRQVVAKFHAGFVAGEPQRRYFTSLGLSSDKIFTGYDAVDNDLFARRAGEIRGRLEQIRNQYELPDHYFLSLGRFVAKKNLGTLLRAYGHFLCLNPASQTHLVVVGSGEGEEGLRKVCQELGLVVYEKAEAGKRAAGNGSAPHHELPPGVHFYGFRQIEENPVFYALADAFVLPSLWEEWGLVVNEAMASGLPVVVSETAGCAEDLLEPGWPAVDAVTRQELRGVASSVRQNGFVFDPNSADALAEVLLALERSLPLRQAMGRASQRIVDGFSCENFAQNALRAALVALGEVAATADAASQPLKQTATEY